MTTYLFDAGPQGATVTNTNQPGISLVNPTTAATFNTATGLRGTFGLLLTAAAGQSGICRITSNASSTTQGFAGVCHMPDTSSQPMTIMTMRHSAGVVLRVMKNTDGRLSVSDSANVITNIVPAGTISADTKYRVELLVVGGSTTSGRIRAAVYAAGGTTPLATPIDITNANLTVNPITGGDLGDTQNAASAIRTMGWEDVRFDAERTTFFGPYTPAVVLEPSTTAVLIGLASNPGNWTGAFSDTSDNNDATYLESPAAPVTDAATRYRVGPVVNPTTFQLTLKHSISASDGTNNCRVRLYQGSGSTLRKEWTVTPPTTPGVEALTLSSAEIATVTDWTNLEVEFVYTGTAG